MNKKDSKNKELSYSMTRLPIPFHHKSLSLNSKQLVTSSASLNKKAKTSKNKSAFNSPNSSSKSINGSSNESNSQSKSSLNKSSNSSISSRTTSKSSNCSSNAFSDISCKSKKHQPKTSVNSMYNDFKELQEPFQECVLAIIDVSIESIELYECLDIILKYLLSSSLTAHSYKSICRLLEVGDKAPSDVKYLLIAISVLLVNEGIPPSTSQMKIIRKYIRQLVRDRKKLESFENKQNIAKRNLIRFHGFFISPKNHTQEDCPTKEKNSNDLNSSLIYLNKLTPDDDLDNDHFGIDLIISYVRKFIKCSGNDYIERYIRWEFPDLGNSYIPNKSTNSLLIDSRHSSLISYNSTANNSLLLNENNLDDFSEISKISDVDICDVESSNCTLSLSRCSQIPINIEISETTKRLKALFTDWNTAYEATIAVWEVMQNERDYDVQELMNSLSFPYAMFLVSAINSYQNDR